MGEFALGISGWFFSSPRLRDGRGSVCHPEQLIDVLEVLLHGTGAETELGTDVDIGRPVGDEGEHLAFPGAEPDDRSALAFDDEDLPLPAKRQQTHHHSAAVLLEHNPAAGKVDAPLKAGTVVEIPRTISYTVKAGDMLGTVAKHLLGDVRLYKAIIELSADRADFLSRLFSKRRPAGLGPKPIAYFACPPAVTVNSVRP